jgi:hypothetical protein
MSTIHHAVLSGASYRRRVLQPDQFRNHASDKAKKKVKNKPDADSKLSFLRLLQGMKPAPDS